MGIQPYLKDIGRGKDGARPLTRAQASALMTDVLAGKLSDLELGAFCMAMRMKGETGEELAGFVDATHAFCHPWSASPVPTVVLPSYNGSRRLPLLVPALGLALAQRGVRVLVHGPQRVEGRITSAQVIEALCARDATARSWCEKGDGEAGLHWRSTESVCPALARLLAVRQTLGLRNSGHSVAKLIAPLVGPAWLVTSHTHPEFLVSMTQALGLTGQAAVLLRGTEGEAVADLRRRPDFHVLKPGEPVRTVPGDTGALNALPPALQATDLDGMVRHTLEMLHGRHAMPAPMQSQVDWLCALLATPLGAGGRA